MQHNICNKILKKNMKKSDNLLKAIKKNVAAYVFLLPLLILLVIIKYYPFVTGVIKSFYNWNAANVNEFVGLANFKELFADPKFLVSMKQVLIYASSLVLINLVMPFTAVELVYNLKNSKLKNFFKLGFIIPLVVPMIVIILMWKWIYAGNYGVLNQFLSVIGLEEYTHAWLGEKQTALGAIIFIRFPWIAGLYYLIYFAGLQNIPVTLNEAAKIDGVTTLKRIFKIDIPLIYNQFKLVLILSIIKGFQIFQEPLVLTDGGPGISTLTPALYMYQKAFSYNRYGYASAIGVLLLVVMAVLTSINQKFINKSDSRN